MQKSFFFPQTTIFPPPLHLLRHHNLPSPYTSLSAHWCIFSESTKPKLKPDPYLKNVKDLAGNGQGTELPGAARFTAFAAVCCMLPRLEPQAGVWSGLCKAGPRSEVSAQVLAPTSPNSTMSFPSPLITFISPAKTAEAWKAPRRRPQRRPHFPKVYF